MPIFVGQMPAPGIMVGLGGLYVSLTAGKPGVGAGSLVAAIAGVGLATLTGTLIGGSAAGSAAALFVVAFALGGMTILLRPVTAQVGFVMTIVFAVMLGLPGGVATPLPRAAQIAGAGRGLPC